MVLWILFALMTAALLAVVLRPLMRGVADGDGPADPQQHAVYKSQITEIDADVARGTLSAAEAEGLRAEVARRLLAQHGDEPPVVEQTENLSDAPVRERNRSAAMAVLVLVPLGSLLTYLAVGSPFLPSQPHASRVIQNADGARFAELVRRVEAQLVKKPDDGRGWDVIAPVYMKMGRYGDAAEAFRNANRLLGETPARLLGHAEAMVFSDNGIVSERARKTFAKVMVKEPSSVPAAYWLAIAKEQDGDLDAARDDLAKLVERVGKGSPLGSTIGDHLRVVEAKIKGGSGVKPAGLSDPETREMIEGMVSGLAARLETDKDDFDGWMRLIRSYVVLGRGDDAIKSLKTARKQFADKPEQIDQLQKLAKDLRIGT